MRRPKIYLETTMFNYYFDAERDAHADTVKLFEEVKAGRFEAYTSAYVIGELANAPDEKRNLMMGLLTEFNITVLDASNEADKLAAIYQKQGIIPKTNKIDAQHIAAATVSDLDMLLSLNFKHIVRQKTVKLTAFVNVSMGYRQIEICSPMEVVEND